MSPSPNLLEQKFHCLTPNVVWLADITYIDTDEGWLYLAGIKDMATREIVGWTTSVGGFLFRRRETRTHKTFQNAEISAATPIDIHSILAINDDSFENEGEIAGLIETDKLWTVRVDGEIAGCGVVNQFIEGHDAVDVGMMVAPDYRRKGLGTYIVSEIANKIEREGLRPICGCGASNAASKATLEKAGFVSDHQLLSFTT